MQTKEGNYTHEKAVEKLAKLIKGIRIAMLTTVDEEGGLRSRPMATQQMEFDGNLWFFTGRDTAKIHEVDREHHVNVSYADPDGNRYVSVSGMASLVQDKGKAEELWNPAYKAWFPQGLDDPNLCLLRVQVDKAEYWDSPSSAVVHIVGFVKAIATGHRYDPGENQKVRL